MDFDTIKRIVEAALLASDRPLSVETLAGLFRASSGEAPSEENAADADHSFPNRPTIKAALTALGEECASRCVELKELASGFRYQIRTDYAIYIQRLWAERSPRYSRALLETLAIIAYRQPVTRGEIEEIRGVSVASATLKTLREREWIRVLGHRDVPGRPAMYGTTREFLDYFGLQTLDDMPPLGEIRDTDPDGEGN
uniref:Segregation and condensation protein B n=1 Tax=Candidatus Kentrum eta TaxID=2126337 RepID=A0A450VB56_9GAMM|nr:MAG: segregation and condensation protein B [Candidatus Kentron sp. H]VFJ95823.1 MAG: segregation and condensation protein B [Candidatus Kentron sp. H]VFK02003.1 MAG: segregation and condensation protein B [Candidatus Kentron sp. H]